MRNGFPIFYFSFFIFNLALALRLYRLDAQSFWYDEGNSARIAERSLRLIVEGAAGDIHPPLYYIALAAWRALLGESEFVLRALSALCGVLLVIFTFGLGQTLAGRRVGQLGAWFVALSPFAIYYSQEARMYAPLALCATAAAWALFALLGRLQQAALTPSVWQGAGYASPVAPFWREWRLMLVYLSATVAGLYTQYAYPFAMIAQGLGVLLWYYGYMQSRKFDRMGQILQPLAIYALVNGVAIAAYAPWLPIAFRQVLGWSVAAQDYVLRTALLDVARWLVVGRTLPLGDSTWAMATVGILALLGLWPRSQRGTQPYAAFILLLLLVVPVALLFVFNLYRDAYLKFLLVCVPPLGLLVAKGAENFGFWILEFRFLRRSPKPQSLISRPQSLILNLCFIFGLGALFYPSLRNLYFNPAYARDDYRGIARLVQSLAKPGDAVLFNAPNQWEVFTYYHKPEREIAPPIALRYRPNSEADVIAEVQQLTQRYKRLFVLYFAERESDPGGWYERALALQAHKAGDDWVGNIRLAQYAVPPAPLPRLPISATLGAQGQIALDSAGLAMNPYSVGGLVPLTLNWRAAQPIAGNYKVFVHIGPVDGPPIAQNDAEPAAGFRPTSQWAQGQPVADPHAVWLKPGTPPGEYAVLVGMYDANTGQRLPIRSSLPVYDNRLVIGKITVAP
ncbi:MAG: glycosyltransferase family 39 protein [Anaerolineae bacterium]|nr:glycosyltransferase family 39 protein [Anaerolineae bacterium]